MPEMYLLPPNLKREVIAEQNGKNEKTFKIVKATMEDLQAIVNMGDNEFLRHNPWTSHIDISHFTEEQKRESFNRNIPFIEKGLYLLAIDGNNLCGFAQCEIETLEENVEKFKGFKKDYTGDLEKYVKAAECFRPIILFIDELNKNLPYHITPGKYWNIRRLCVAKEYLGNGLGQALWVQAMKMGKFQGYRYVTAECTAKASTCIAEKNGMPTVFAFPLDRMIINNTQIWPSQLTDGLTSMNLVIGDLSTMNFK